MRAVVQRCLSASVRVDDKVIASISEGLVVLVAVTHSDETAHARQLASKVHELKVFRDGGSIATSGQLLERSVLVVSQFTLYADTRRGRRPSWSAAASRDIAEPLVDAFVTHLQLCGTKVYTGQFGADMQVELVNDGPVTLILEV